MSAFTSIRCHTQAPLLLLLALPQPSFANHSPPRQWLLSDDLEQHFEHVVKSTDFEGAIRSDLDQISLSLSTIYSGEFKLISENTWKSEMKALERHAF